MNFTGEKHGQKSSGTGKFECKTCVHLKFIFISKKICLVFKISGTGKFVYKTVFNSKNMSSSSKPPVPANLHTRQVFISQNMCYYQSSKPPVPANLHARQVFIFQNISSSSSSKLSCTVKFACKYTAPIQSNSFLKISGLF